MRRINLLKKQRFMEEEQHWAFLGSVVVIVAVVIFITAAMLYVFVHWMIRG